MKTYKRILGLALAGVMTVMCFTGCAIKKNAAVIGTVNGENVTSDYYQYYMQIAQSEMVTEAQLASAEEVNAYWDTEIDGKKAIDVLRERTQDELTAMFVMAQKAKEEGFTIEDADSATIKSQLTDYKTQLGGESAYKDALKELGLTNEAFVKLLEMETLAGKLQQKIVSDNEDYEFTDEEAKEYAENQEKITAKHILFDATNPETGEPLTDEAKAEIKAVAQEALDKIKNGEENFDDVMNDLSADPGLATNPDGYTFGKGEMVKEFEEAAFALEVGEMSELVETEYGFHIIKREARVIDETEIETAKQEMIADLYQKQIDEWVAEAKVEFDAKQIEKIKPMEY